MPLKSAPANVARLAAGLILAAELVHLLRPVSRCRDLTFPLGHPRRNITVAPLNPAQGYADLLTFTYHSGRSKLMVNNARCQLLLSGVAGMTRTQLQNLKPYVIKGVIRHARAPHVAYIDWDANFIGRPWAPPVDLVVQAAPVKNVTNTGTLIFFNARKYIPLIDRWITHEMPTNADQQSWARMEKASKVFLHRTADGDVAENYNWNIVGKIATTARCKKVIFFLNYFRLLLNLGVIVAVVLKVYDLWSMESKGHCPRRVSLSVVLALAIVCAVMFKENYHEQVENSSKFESERICAIPELALKENGLLVTRRDTTTGPNPFLRAAIKLVGLGRVSSVLSFWYSLLAGLRRYARVMLAIELFSVLSLLVVRRRGRPESVLWCTMIVCRDFEKRGPLGRLIVKMWRDGRARFELSGKHGEILNTADRDDLGCCESPDRLSPPRSSRHS